MKNFPTPHIKEPDVWETRAPCPGLLLLGIPFLAMGLFAVAGALGIVKIEIEAPRHVFLFVGLLFSTAGAILAFGRGGVTIDRRRKMIIKWFGIGVLLRREEFFTDAFELVSLTREIRSGKNNNETVYPVVLKGAVNPSPLEIETASDYKTARRTAEELAGFLGKPLEDSSTGTPVVSGPEELGRSDAEEVGDRGAGCKVPEAPAGMRSEVSIDGAEIVVDIPPLGFNFAGYLSLAIGTVVPAVMVHGLFIPLKNNVDSPGGYLFLGLLALFIIVPTAVTWAGAFNEANKRVRVSASPLGISLEETGLNKGKIWSMPANEIEELNLNVDTDDVGEQAPGAGINATFPPPGGYIVVRGAGVTFRFGQGLGAEELRYLHTLIKRAIIG